MERSSSHGVQRDISEEDGMSRLFTAFSIVIHGIVIAGVVVAQLVAVGPLPLPRQPLMFENPRFVTLPDIQLPAPPRRSIASGPAEAVVTGAPIVEPASISPETGRENARAYTPDIDARVGVAGITGTIDLGTVEGVAAPPAPPPPPVKPLRLHEGIQPPRKTVDVSPTYPALARMIHVEGVVILEAVIDARGTVESVRVLRSIQLLDQAAVDAVRHWRFTPALLNGEPVPVVMTVTVKFSLENR
jgi:protein TonB